MEHPFISYRANKNLIISVFFSKQPKKPTNLPNQEKNNKTNNPKPSKKHQK